MSLGGVKMGKKLKSKTLYGITYGDGASASYPGVAKWSPDRKIKVKGVSVSHWCSAETGNWSNVVVAKHREDFYGGRMNNAASADYETENVLMFHEQEPYGTYAQGLGMQQANDSVMFGDDWMEVDDDEAIYVSLFKGSGATMYSLYAVTVFYE